jgi:GrpB-like predicted nucleotidyltransferase (UPF0157 family)
MIEKYSSNWPEKYSNEKELLKLKLGDLIYEIEHIGSTAIPGISAKPIIDIMAAVKSLPDAEKFIPLLEELGYEYKPDMSSTERMFFRKGDPIEFHLSIAQPDHTTYWERQKLFRDFLINHSEYAEEYEKIKLGAISDIPESETQDLSRSKIYNEKKGPFVQKIIQLAIQEKDETKN